MQRCPPRKGTTIDPKNTLTTELETNNEDCDKLPVVTAETLSLVISSISEIQDINHSATSHSISTSESPTTLEPNRDNLSIRNLPTSSEATFCWGEFDGKTFSCALNKIYDEIVHWKKKPFQSFLKPAWNGFLWKSSPRCLEPTLMAQPLKA